MRVVTEPREGRTLLGPPRPTTVAMAVVATLVIVSIAVAVPVSDQGGYRSFPGYMVFLAICTWAMVLAATARIEAQGAELVLVNWATVRRLNRSDILGVDGSNGIVIKATSGTYEAVGYGSSLVQHFLPSRRYAQVAERIRTWAGVGGTQSRPPIFETLNHLQVSGGHRQTPVPARPRRMLVLGLPIALVSAQLLGVVLWLNCGIIYSVIVR